MSLDLCFGGEGGCRACHMHFCQLRSPRGGRLDGFYFCLSFRRVYFWARKSQEKLDTQIRASPVQDSRHGCCLCKVASSLTFCAQAACKASAHLTKWRDQKQARQEEPLSILRGSTFGSLLKYICFAQGSKTGPSAFWIWCLPGGLFDAPFKYYLEARCWNQATNISATHHSNYKGGPHRVSKKSADFRY